MSTVAILVRPAHPKAARLAAEAALWLNDHGHEVRLLESPGKDGARGGDPLTVAELSGADLAVSLGGDGTFLRLVPLAYAAGVPVMGVNFGRLGYLLEVEPDRMITALERAVAGDAVLEDRTVLAVTVEGTLTPAPGDDRSLPDPDGGGRWWVGLNEMVVEKTVPGHMVSLSTAVDGQPCLSYNADGVLVATPTGSTAYNLSAGGPVISPRLRAMVLTPVAPHLSIGASVVMHPDQVVTVGLKEGQPAVLVVDGREVGQLAPGAAVSCRVAPEPVRFVLLGERGFAGLLRTTLAPDQDP